ncbi:MAG: PssE/Cps14G family polysaccharide biosynthesis glycosyltransferase, partial [archaeon]|nr:PssE/Cps14G family polysaccharide biosynthesis glycosyltransferase [archaeon]
MTKIFVSVGTHPQQFNRLLEELDKLAGTNRLGTEIFAQTGNSNYTPKNFKSEKFVGEKDYNSKIGKADVIVSHGGAGTIINALRSGKKLVVVPRLKKFGEHTNNHQLDLAKSLEKQGKCLAVYNIAELGNALKKA